MKSFHEIQRFKQWWLWIILLVPVVMLAGSAVTLYNSPVAEKSRGITALAVALVFTMAAFVWTLLLRLETRLENGVLAVNFKGMPFAKRTIVLQDTEKLEIVTYDPLFDYGGWGLRYGIGKGWCYNVSGDKGLLVTFHNKKTLMIGTQKPEELAQALGLPS